MSLARTVAAEALDHLPANDPAAIRSRRDLHRVHLAMGTRLILRRALQGIRTQPQLHPHPGAEPKTSGRRLRVLELGAGDGTLMLGIAKAQLPAWSDVDLTLLDRQALVGTATIEAYAQAGWKVQARIQDVFAWACEPAGRAPRWDLVIANLFMHHFEPPELRKLLRAIAQRADGFLAAEPRRSRIALTGSHLVALLGANAVTRQDAVLSVHAGFRDQELSQLWPSDADAWQLRERAAGLFSHCFIALRRGAERCATTSMR